MVRIRLFGGLEVITRNGEIARFTTRKSSLLFAALVLGGLRGCRREQLAEAFWPRREEEQTRNSLRQALVHIRKLFANSDGIRIDTDQHTVLLAASPDEVDVWILDQLHDGHRTTDLVVAADLYRGDILAGEIPEELEEWFRPSNQLSSQGASTG